MSSENDTDDATKLFLTNLMLSTAMVRAALAKGLITKAELTTAMTAPGMVPSLANPVIEECWNQARAIIKEMPGS